MEQATRRPVLDYAAPTPTKGWGWNVWDRLRTSLIAAAPFIVAFGSGGCLYRIFFWASVWAREAGSTCGFPRFPIWFLLVVETPACLVVLGLLTLATRQFPLRHRISVFCTVAATAAWLTFLLWFGHQRPLF